LQRTLLIKPSKSAEPNLT